MSPGSPGARRAPGAGIHNKKGKGEKMWNLPLYVVYIYIHIYIYVERESRIVHRYMNDMTHIFIYVIFARIVHDINRI